MKYVELVQNWLNFNKDNHQEIKDMRDKFMNAFIERHPKQNEFDLIDIYQVFLLIYSLGATRGLKTENIGDK